MSRLVEESRALSSRILLRVPSVDHGRFVLPVFDASRGSTVEGGRTQRHFWKSGFLRIYHEVGPKTSYKSGYNSTYRGEIAPVTNLFQAIK